MLALSSGLRHIHGIHPRTQSFIFRASNIAQANCVGGRLVRRLPFTQLWNLENLRRGHQMFLVCPLHTNWT